MRLGQVHCAAPFAADHFGQVDCFQRITGVMFQRLDLALRHQRVQLQRKASTAHHLVHGGCDSHRQAHPTVFGRGPHAGPAALGNRSVAFRKSGRGSHDTVLQNRALQITGALKRGQNLFAQLAGLGQDRLNQIG